MIFTTLKQRQNQKTDQNTYARVALTPLLILLLAFLFSPLLAQTKGSDAAKTKPLLNTRIKTILASGTVRQFKFTDSLKVPDKVSFIDEQGKTRSLKEWRGKTILVNFWAPWCEACREELPSMQRLRRRLDRQEFEIIALNVENDASKGRAYLDKLDIKNIISVLDKDKAALKKLTAIGVPTSILFDCKGRELGRLRGSAVWNADAAILLIKGLMRVTGCYDEERDKV